MSWLCILILTAQKLATIWELSTRTVIILIEQWNVIRWVLQEFSLNTIICLDHSPQLQELEFLGEIVKLRQECILQWCGMTLWQDYHWMHHKWWSVWLSC